MTAAPDKAAALPSSNASRAWRRLRESPAMWCGAALVALMLGVAPLAGVLAPYTPDHRSGAVLEGPTSEHWLGTDKDSKDVFARVMYGSRLSLITGVISISLAVLIGAPLGSFAGWFGGWVDTMIMRSIDVALAFPSILVALLVATAFTRGWVAVIVAVGLINTPVFARQVRVTVLTVKDLEYVTASRALGAGSLRILLIDILPALISPILVLATLGLGSAILEVAALSFLGIAGEPTDPEWGSMLTQAKDVFRSNPWFAIGPGIAISLTILGFNLLGDALRDALDPRLGKATA